MTTFILPLMIDLLSLLAYWLLGRRRRSGWLVSLLALSILWPTYAVLVGSWGFFPGIVAHVLVAWRGFALWGRGTSGTPSPLH